MTKLFILLCILSTSSVFAGPLENMMTMKERIRISLWREGLDDQQPKTNSRTPRKVILPEELERSLRKM